MLLEMAIGDAYGAAFEFIDAERQAKEGLVNDGATFQKHPELPIGNGRYTDDTQMAVAIAEVMLAPRSRYDGKVTKAQLFDGFYDTFARDKRPGYGSRFFELLNECNSGEELQARIMNDSARSGACMRVGPIGLYASHRDVMGLAELQARTTHNTDDGVACAQAIALMTHYFAYDIGPKAGLGKYLEALVPGYTWSLPHHGWTTVMALPCAQAAITVVMQSGSLTEVLKNSVAVGGDVDTIAAMAMFAASLTPEIDAGLPESLLDGLENGPYGKDFLTALDEKLHTFAREFGAKV